MKFTGKWMSTDTGKGLLYTINLKDGSTTDYTSATSIVLHAYCAARQLAFTLSGSVSNGPSRIFSFASPAATATAPVAGTTDAYRFYISYTYSTKSYATDPDAFAIEAWPV